MIDARIERERESGKFGVAARKPKRVAKITPFWLPGLHLLLLAGEICHVLL